MMNIKPDFPTSPGFLADGGTMGTLIQVHDWSASPLGPPATWPQALKTAVSLMLQSRQPAYIAWGPEQISLYNDGLDRYLPLSVVRARLSGRYTLEDLDERTGGLACYVRVRETGGKPGFITPMTHNFCESCNRVRLTCTGQLFMCLGQEDAADLRVPVRASDDDGLLEQAIEDAIARKPKGHDFIIDRRHDRPAG